jgi:hypothetical protein
VLDGKIERALSADALRQRLRVLLKRSQPRAEGRLAPATMD